MNSSGDFQPFQSESGLRAGRIEEWITWIFYAEDKRSATAGKWRVPESTLHLCELCGGWPAAFLAQRRLRHKCSKAGYQATFWLIVLLHQITALDLILGHDLSRMAWRYLTER